MEQKISNLVGVMEAANHSKNSAVEAENHVKNRANSKNLKSREDFLRFVLLFVIASLIISCSRPNAIKQVCFTFDDLPLAHNIDSFSYVQTFTKLVNRLKVNNIPAIGFVNESKLFSNDSLIQWRYDLIKLWVSSGLQLGNHTYSHPDYTKISLKEYAKDIEKGAEVTKHLMTNESGYYYFRHPFLRVGDSKEKADSLSNYLESNNYKVAPVTIDHDDYIFANAYRISVMNQDSIMTEKIKNDYFVYMEQNILYFETLTKKVFGRNINQILLLHNNQLNADCIDDLIKLFKSHDYKFTSLYDALNDPVYQAPINNYVGRGASWVERWAKSKNVPDDNFNDDPSVPEYIISYIKITR